MLEEEQSTHPQNKTPSVTGKKTGTVRQKSYKNLIFCYQK